MLGACREQTNMSEPIVFIPLTQGKVAVIDFADFELVRDNQWYASSEKSGGPIYARRTIRHPNKPGKQACVQMHTQITGWDSVDHWNGNGLDNRRMNLKNKNHSENMRSFLRKQQNTTSRFKGVHWNSNKHKWVAYIRIKGQQKELGRFNSEEEAARIRDTAAIKAGFYEEALNFPSPRPDDFRIL